MNMYHLIILFGCFLGALLVLQGVTLWLKHDVPKAVAIAGMGMFVIMTISSISVVTAVDQLLEEKIQKYGVENTIGAVIEWKYPNG